MAVVLLQPVACLFTKFCNSVELIVGTLLSLPVNVFPLIEVINFLNAKSNSLSGSFWASICPVIGLFPFSTCTTGWSLLGSGFATDQ